MGLTTYLVVNICQVCRLVAACFDDVRLALELPRFLPPLLELLQSILILLLELCEQLRVAETTPDAVTVRRYGTSASGRIPASSTSRAPACRYES
jgi:hypothetical protein